MSIGHDVELLARIIEHTPIGIAILTRDRKIRYVNARAEKLFNCARETLLGTSVDRFIVDRQGEMTWREMWPRIMTGKILEARTGLARQGKDEELTCSFIAFCIGGREGRPDSAAIIFRDITQELTIAEQLEKKNIEMAKMNTELIHSNIELMRVSELKSNFLSIASHELKTPLTSIMGYSDIIIDNMKERIDGGVYRMIESINRAAGRLNKVINNILDVTRIEQKRLRLRPETFDIAHVARECIDELADVAARRGIMFNRNFDATLPQFFGDRSRLAQVFTNLLTNAVKYSPDGSPVDIVIALEDGARFHITVADRGIGIDKSEHKNIFDPFYEVADITKHSTDHIKFMGGGTGLGLSIVKGIVERHGGRIWVESAGMGVHPDEYPGSAFHIVLPVKPDIAWDDIESEPRRPPLESGDAAAKAPGTQGAGPADHKKPTILIIDTDSEAVEISRMVLENAFDIVTAPSGEVGLSMAFHHRPFMVLLDSALPGMDGYRICKLLRSQEETCTTPIIFLSSETRQEEIERCFASGADGFIVKPFGGRELLDKIWQLLMKKKAESVE